MVKIFSHELKILFCEIYIITEFKFVAVLSRMFYHLYGSVCIVK
jgi:hypothetical protein